MSSGVFVSRFKSFEIRLNQIEYSRIGQFCGIGMAFFEKLIG